MKTFFKISLAVFLIAFLIQTNTAKSDILTASKTSELNSQIMDEVKEVLKSPYLKYETRNLNGKVSVVTEVTENGKIIFKDITGINENLRESVKAKLNSLNLWTSPVYAGKIFYYKLDYRN